MKSWKNPEVKVFNVKMNENIAASDDQKLLVNFNPGGDILVYVNGRLIVDTVYGYYMSGNKAIASNAYEQNTGSTGDWVLNSGSCRV